MFSLYWFVCLSLCLRTILPKSCGPIFTKLGGFVHGPWQESLDLGNDPGSIFRFTLFQHGEIGRFQTGLPVLRRFKVVDERSRNFWEGRLGTKGTIDCFLGLIRIQKGDHVF